jgi:Protein of unknown function (DUF3631)
MTLPPPKVCQRIRKLHAMVGSSSPKEAHNAHDKLNHLLAEHGLTWNDLPRILTADISDTGEARDAGTGPAAPAAAPTEDDIPDLLGLILRLIEDHISTTAEERLAIALWILHCWVFDRFAVTPRLTLISPVRGCGKTITLSLIELLIPEGNRTDNTTAAAIYYALDRRQRTVLLVDEADGLDLYRNNVLRSLFNSGHRRGGSINRFVGGRPQRYRTFAPLGVAAIGMLPLPLLHRAVVINMQRSSAQLRRLDETSLVFHLARQGIQKWAASCTLAPDPEMPPVLRNRAADNWRVLLSIADDLGYSEAARSAAVTLCANRPDEDPGVVLLADIRTVFQARGVDRIASLALVEAMVGMDDGPWNEWRGPNDDRPARKLTQGEMAGLLRPFGIRPKTIWPAGRQLGGKSSRGYMRSQFEEAWRAYCPPTDTSTQSSKIIQLPGP